jgi:hypothetical protein
MQYLLNELEAQPTNSESLFGLSALQRAYRCQCDRAVFFGNSHCLSCDSPLGYEPGLGRVFSLVPGPEAGFWRLAGPNGREADGIYTRCANLNTAAACNWLVKSDERNSVQPLCISCRLTRTIPNLSQPDNKLLWARLENAKRRVVSALLALRLPVASRVSEDAERGLAFDFLQSPPNGPRVLTGHDNGLITVNVEEADDVKREQIRSSMHEPYRTLIGHLRHEVGHYYWDRLVANSAWLEEFRSLFGDERTDYRAALQKNYSHPPPNDWPQRYVSSYASVHPWEDWAETWAHYMHMIDTLATAMSFGLRPETIAMPFDCFGADAVYQPKRFGCEPFLSFLNAWLKLTAVVNELCRGMGQPDFYPFALPRAAITKLHFIHTIVCEASMQFTVA